MNDKIKILQDNFKKKYNSLKETPYSCLFKDRNEKFYIIFYENEICYIDGVSLDKKKLLERYQYKIIKNIPPLFVVEID